MGFPNHLRPVWTLGIGHISGNTLLVRVHDSCTPVKTYTLIWLLVKPGQYEGEYADLGRITTILLF